MGVPRRFKGALFVVTTAAAGLTLPVGDAAASPVCKGLRATIIGSPRSEEIEGTRGRDVIHAGPGDDVVRGRGGRDVLCGGPGSDAVAGGSGADRLFGNDGRDALDGGPGGDFLDGEKGHDVATFESARRGLTIDLDTGLATGQGSDRVHGIESAVGGRGDDVIRGTERANLLAGGNGDDRLFGLGGPDVVQPLEGDDRADGGTGTDVLSYSLSSGAVAIDPVDGDGTERLQSFEALQGSAFPDVIAGTKRDDVLLGSAGGDEFRPGGGDDFVDGELPLADLDEVVYEDAPRGVLIALQLVEGKRVGEAKGNGTDVLVRVDSAVGSRFDDVMAGHAGPNSFTGGRGDDAFVPGPGDDTVVAGGGEDLVSFAAAAAPLVVDLGWGTATGDGADTLVGVEAAEGSAFDDLIEGSASENHLFGGEGSDRMNGGEGPDLLEGGAGDDLLFGDAGDDALVGGGGLDSADGGADTDECEAEQLVDCESSARQASRWERHLRKINQAITDSGKVTSPASPISEFRNLIRLIALR